MNFAEKKALILAAIKKGKIDKRFTKNKIDPGEKGNNIRKLERGEKISLEKLNQMCVYILQTQGKSVPITLFDKQDSPYLSEDKKTKGGVFEQGLEKKVIQQEKTLAKLDKKLGKLESKLETLETCLANLAKSLDKVNILESKIKEIETNSNDTNKTQKPEKVRGFTVVQKEVRSGQKRYLKWYAYKQIDGKLKWIYIGGDKSKSKRKINQWLRKNKVN